MKRTIINLLCGGLVCAAIVPASGLAAENSKLKSPAINGREHNQQLRIRQGVKSGELTRKETARLEAEEARIRLNERLAKSDGKLTPEERARLEKELSKASHDIYVQKHDDQTRE
jgi:hypothetical protein